jgi:hypothetical protein
MPSNLMPFGEWRPDVADYEGKHSHVIQNVVPQGDGYGPVAAFVATSGTLAAACRGIFYALKNDGTVAIFAGTSTKLYLLNNSSQTWADVSLGGGSYTALANNENWQFAQFNNFVFAVQGNAAPQVYDLTSSTAFANLGGSPPQAKYVAIVNQFVVLSGIATSNNVYRVQWSGLGATTTWTAGVSQSDFQDLADGGIVRGVVGGEFGYIFQDRTIRQMSYAPGSQYVFEIDRLSDNDGIYAPYGMVNAGARVFYISPQGFKMIVPGLLPQPIGKERVDRTFFADVDASNLGLVIAAADPKSNRVFWAYKSNNGTAGQFDKVMVYDYALDRWAQWVISGQYITQLANPGLTLEAVDAAYGDASAPSTSSNQGTILSSNISLGGSTGDTWTFQNTYKAGTALNFTGTLPSGYAVGTPYYVSATGLTTSQFKLSAGGGIGTWASSVVTSSSSGSGSITIYAPSLDNLNIASLDNINSVAVAQFGAVGPTNAMGFFTGSNLAATLETAQHGDGYKRIYVNGVRPITDAPGVTAALITVENLQTSPTTGAAATVDARGFVPLRASTRYARAKVTIPAGKTWTFASGVEPAVSDEGLR